MKRVKILISGLSLPTQKLGSWLTRIQLFQANLNYFDFILSPTEFPDERFIYCEKQPVRIWHKLKNQDTQSFYAATQFVSVCKNLCKKGIPLQILVMDDTFLLQGVSQLKGILPLGSEVVFSFHGHWLSVLPNVLDRVDKVFFLTTSGYLKTINSNFQLTPQVFVVGNGVENEFFFPLHPEEKSSAKRNLGFGVNDRVILWMANSRRVKGLHLFKKIVYKILEKYPEVKIVSIGHPPDKEITHSSWLQLGRLPHKELPKYLQISDIYFFTSLWQEGFGLSLVEAIKCGNWAIASDLGGIPDVLSEQKRAILVAKPNVVDSWLLAFDNLLEKIETDECHFDSLKKQLAGWHSYRAWEARFLEALLD